MTATVIPQPTDADFAARRPWYTEQLADGVDRFLEPRRTTCPWCGSDRLTLRVRTSELLQRKPGVFTLDQCGACAHVFQNPRLTAEGLRFYYRDVYDGLGAFAADAIMAAGKSSYLGRAKMVAPFLTPKTWLDVGTGYGHFCKTAATVWPDTAFDGLDMGAGVEEGRRRGWLRQAYRGQFPDLADGVVGGYDVVSMNHYLEHTIDPRAELDAVARSMKPGAYLLIEVPDPSTRLARVLGRRWIPYLQPQHLNLIPSQNLRRALEERGLTPVAFERGRAHQPMDFAGAVFAAFVEFAPDPRLPWLPEPSAAAARRRFARASRVMPPFVVLGLLLDRCLAPLIRALDGGNAYRILARKDADA